MVSATSRRAAATSTGDSVADTVSTAAIRPANCDVVGQFVVLLCDGSHAAPTRAREPSSQRTCTGSIVGSSSAISSHMSRWRAQNQMTLPFWYVHVATAHRFCSPSQAIHGGMGQKPTWTGVISVVAWVALTVTVSP